MSKDAAITVRIPARLKTRLAARAKREHRSVSAQVVHELELALVEELRRPPGRRALGLFDGARLPSEADFVEVRAALWGSLGRRDG
jgi:hypothetical protein